MLRNSQKFHKDWKICAPGKTTKMVDYMFLRRSPHIMWCFQKCIWLTAVMVMIMQLICMIVPSLWKWIRRTYVTLKMHIRRWQQDQHYLYVPNQEKPPYVALPFTVLTSERDNLAPCASSSLPVSRSAAPCTQSQCGALPLQGGCPM